VFHSSFANQATCANAGAPRRATGNDAFSHGVFVQHIERLWGAKWEHQIIGDGFDARTGFAPPRRYH
jgi:hypothetical protein